ncbi:hypothetical protein QFX71_003400 [Citrobacter amalonaticus]|nr:hypothetical protein [Citrobacter amalonaticus]
MIPLPVQTSANTGSQNIAAEVKSHTHYVLSLRQFIGYVSTRGSLTISRLIFTCCHISVLNLNGLRPALPQGFAAAWP